MKNDNDIEVEEKERLKEIDRELPTIPDMKEKIISVMKESTYVPMKIKEMAYLLEWHRKAYYEDFKMAMAQLIREGNIILTKKNKKLYLAKNLYEGIFHSHAKGFGFVEVRDGNTDNIKDIFIHATYVNGAVDKDIVKVRLIPLKTGKSLEGEITAVIQRTKKTIVGTFEKSQGFGFVRPDNAKIPYDIFILEKDSKNAISGHKVLVSITKQANDLSKIKRSKPEGEVVEILGHINDPGVDILSIVNQFELPTDFPQDVYEEVEKLADSVQEKHISSRVDLRSLTTVTIDGEDAKDLDDAISLEKLKNGNFRLGVHIADVTYYVREGTKLDKEALKRGTSVYLVDRVIPMLPHKLSNGVCSLNANVDRLALSCIMDIDSKGTVVSHRIAETAINVDKRMSYTEVSSVLGDEESPFLEDYKDFIPMLKQMASLSKILREKRVARGSIEFDFPESKILLDEKGKPIDVKLYKRSFATSIIEEFMLLSNETVAEQFFWLDVPFVFRSHQEPDTEKIEKLSDFISHFGYFLKGNVNHPKNIQNLLSNLENTKEETIINRLILKSLKQAKYTPENDGHFGLAAKHYCHFTSPIRRYPDLQIHRIIKDHLNNRLISKRLRHYAIIIGEVCNISSARERLAEEAERETDNYKKVEFMLDKVGQVFDGVISGVTSWGVYVELPNTVEGMVAVGNMRDDYYVFDEERYALVGERLKKVYTLGDKVTVQLVRANLDIRKLDFIFAEDEEDMCVER